MTDQVERARARPGAAPPNDALLATAMDEERHRDAFRLAIAMTLLTVIVRPPPETHIFATVAAIGGVVVWSLTRTRWYWLVLLGLYLIGPLSRPWLALDNHHYLEIYWLSAIALSRWAVRPDEVLREAARLLVGLAFAFAVFWKLWSPDFIDGAFFEFQFSTDSRLADVVVAAGVQESELAAENRRAIAEWRRVGATPEPKEAVVSQTVHRMAPVLAWLTVLIEGSVAVAFLLPLAGRWRRARDVTLLVFVVTTYPLAPVIGFGWLLLAMGAMHSELPRRARNVVYASTFVVLALLRERRVVLDFFEQLTTGLPGG
jgi:hypothetical protein